MKPLRISKNKVNTASFQPPDLRTLVAPIFFEPILRGSFFLNKIESKIPNGIEPHR